MDWNALFHSKYLRGGLCAVLIAAILLGLWLPGTGLKEAQPDDPLAGKGVREITVLELGENIQQLNTIVVPSGGQTKSTEPNDDISETRPEETRPDSSTDDGSDGQEDGNQGADGGEISPSELSLVLTWHPDSGNAKSVSCAADNTQAFAVSSYELNEGLFHFSVHLTGTLAQDAKIVDGISITESTRTSKELSWPSGSVPMAPAAGTDKEVYNFSFTVRTQERDVFFRYKITYQKLPDVQLSFTWRGTGSNRGTLICLPNGSVADKIKNNQLAGGRISYEMKLVGSDAESAGAKILSASYTSDEASKSGELNYRTGEDALIMTMPEGETSNTYRISVTALANGHTARFEVVLHYGNDVTLEMRYMLNDGSQREIFCQNKQSRTADTVYDDQLTDGFLEYEMSIVGSDADGVEITAVTCNQSGSVETLNQLERGRIRLLLNAGKAGHNFFEIKAQGENEYSFTIDIPYKHKGTKSIEIFLNLEDQDEIPNESKTTLRVTAHGKDAQGNTVSIPAKGTNEFIQVSLDGIEVVDPTRSGDTWEYGLIPSNPETGDRNEHTLYVYAEDAYGNWGEKELTLIGFRVEPGQIIGEADIYVDMTVLGIKKVEHISYDVLADEPISYVVAKAIMGMDTGEPFGAASDTLGWRGSYAGTLDTGFYLQSLNTDYYADALEDATWPGNTEEEVFAAIDARFGAGSDLAILWRCLYRNGLNKSTGSGSTFGEFDYTSGSGWMYSLDGTYYPGQSMSAVHLNDGDTLTLRYTLAYGWDIGGGSENYGNIVGYCVTAINGDFNTSHRLETVEDPDGSIHHVCYRCGLIQDCTHEHTIYKDLEDGTHILFCEDCQTAIGDPQFHNWTYAAGDTEDNHVCAECGATEHHFWKEVEGTNTATCTEPGVRTVRCSVCGMEKEEEVEAKGHTLDNRWNYTAQEHYQKCSTCGEETNRGNHEYEAEWGDYACHICEVLHEEICGGTPAIKEATCQKIVYHCDSCGYDLTEYGTFDDYHDFVDGFCRYCGGEDPNYVPHEHDYHETYRVDPTCTEDGCIEYTCDCGDTYTDPLPATGHTWGEWTPTGDGEEVRSCEVCGAEDYRTTEEDTYSARMFFLNWLFPRMHQKIGGITMNEKIPEILRQIETVVVGKNEIVEKILMAILAGGHVLMEDVPGVGKTTTAMTFAKVLGLDTKRVQFTSDTVPSDIIGYSVYDKESGSFVYKPGAVMTNLLLADEINRTSSKTQSALLEAMEELHVTVDGKTYELPKPFVVLATQNPVGSAGTQMLPPSQMDRFMIKISMGYPDFESQISILRDRHTENPLNRVTPVVDREQLQALIQEAAKAEIQDTVYEYVTRLTQASREHPMVQLGVSPRGALAVCRMAKAYAYLNGRDFVIPEDVAAVFPDVCCHRLVLTTKARMMEERPETVIAAILDSVKMPVVKQ